MTHPNLPYIFLGGWVGGMQRFIIYLYNMYAIVHIYTYMIHVYAICTLNAYLSLNSFKPMTSPKKADERMLMTWGLIQDWLTVFFAGKTWNPYFFGGVMVDSTVPSSCPENCGMSLLQKTPENIWQSWNGLKYQPSRNNISKSVECSWNGTFSFQPMDFIL